MTFNADEMFQSFKRGGARGLVISLAFAVVFGVLDQFTTRVIPWIAQTIEDVIRPPKFFVSFYPAVDVTGGLRVVDLGVDPPKEVSIKKRDLGKSGTATVFTVWAGPGTYTLQLHGAFAREGQVLSDTKEITKTDESWAVNSSDEHHWAKTEPSNEIARSSAVADDFKIVASVQDDVLRSMLANALGEVGVYERGTDWERRRIESYFATLGVDRVPRDGFGIPMWTLAFVGWVVAQADVQPPDRGALLAGRWLHWGDQVSGNEPIPGAVGVFKSPTDHTPRVAILLRKRKDCIDVIAGDAAGRVAIRCVKSEKLISVRRPPVGDAQGDAKPATSVEDAKPATSTDDVKPATSVEDGGGRKTR